MPASARAGSAQTGSVLIWALLIVVLTSGMVVSHGTYLTATRKGRTARHNRDTLAMTVARSGMTDTLGWFRRQAQQPVTAFTPKYDPEGQPPHFDTIDPARGLVRAFEINGNLWGRYEILREEARDISAQRDAPGGSCWEIGVRASVYRLVDPNVPYHQGPNRMLGSTTLRNEVRTIRLTLPAPAAVAADDPSKIQIGPQATILGQDGAALAFRDPALRKDQAEPTIAETAIVSGRPTALPLSTYDAAGTSVFGMNIAELRGYAEVVLDRNHSTELNGLAEVSDSTVFVSGAVTLENDTNLHNVLFAVDGNLTIPSSAGSDPEPNSGLPTVETVASVRAEIRTVEQSHPEAPYGWMLRDAAGFLDHVHTELLKASPKLDWAANRLASAIGSIHDAEAAGLNPMQAGTWRYELGGGPEITAGGTSSATGTRSIRGIVYVSGNASIEGALILRGALIVRGKLTLGNGEPVSITYDRKVISKVTEFLQRYRERRTQSPGR